MACASVWDREPFHTLWVLTMCSMTLNRSALTDTWVIPSTFNNGVAYTTDPRWGFRRIIEERAEPGPRDHLLRSRPLLWYQRTSPP
jgi:hypothetical protein